MTVSKEEIKSVAGTMAKALADQGKLVEAGWVIHQSIFVPPDASVEVVALCKLAYFAGAQHLWGSLFGMMTESGDVEEIDVTRMEKVHNELQDVYNRMQAMWLKGQQ